VTRALPTLKVLSYVCDGRLGLRPHLRRVIEAALEEGVDVISGQGNGMDGGPAYLGSGETPPPSENDLAPAILGARQAGIPFVFSLGGRAGADVHVAPYFDLLDRIADGAGERIRAAFVRGEIDKAYLKAKLADGVPMRRLVDTPRLPEWLDADEVDRAVRLQAQMGPEPLVDALALYEAGEVDGVLAGRALDLAVHMAYPLTQGFDVATVAHMAKVVECGGLVCEPTNPFTAVIAELGRDNSFVVRPADPGEGRCTVRSVASHALYERSDPASEENPGGVLDISQATYEQVDERSVRCSGARWIPSEYFVKVEGVRSLGHETALFAIARDPALLAQIRPYVDHQVARAKQHVIDGGYVTPEEFRVIVRVTGGPADGGAMLMLRVVAPDAELSFQVANTVRGYLTHGHFERRRTTAGNLAFPMSKAFIRMGEAFVFNVWHLVPLDDPLEPFARSVVEFPRAANEALGSPALQATAKV
jgi:hypothetical protein